MVMSSWYDFIYDGITQPKTKPKGENLVKGKSTGEHKPVSPVIHPINGKRNWYEFTDPNFPREQRTEEERKRMMLGQGPTTEEQAAYDQWKRGMGALNAKIKVGLGTLQNIHAVPLSDYLLAAIKKSGRLDADKGKLEKKQLRIWIAEAFGVTVAEVAKLQNTAHFYRAVRAAFELALVRMAQEKINTIAVTDQQSLLQTFINWYNNQPNLDGRTSIYTVMQQYKVHQPCQLDLHALLRLLRLPVQECSLPMLLLFPVM